MLVLPTTGISRSTTRHNIKLDVLCDWIEANLLFDEKELSFEDVVSYLLEGQIYDNSDMASEMIASAWTELRRRQSWISPREPFTITSRRISRNLTWKRVPAHGFCLLLSLARWYRDWAKQFEEDYLLQGELFEKLISESLSCQFNDWNVFLTGWSRTKTQSLKSIVEDIAAKLGESTGNIGRWSSDRANDAGLDLLMYRPFKDGRVGIPVYLMQCASGSNWTEKLHTPEIEIWGKIIDFAAKPKKAFAMPFALLEREFTRRCVSVDGLLVDRYRILSAANHKKNWMSFELKRKLIEWSNPRIKKLLLLEN